MYASYKKVLKKSVGTKIQPSKEADIFEPPEKEKRLIQDSAPRGTRVLVRKRSIKSLIAMTLDETLESDPENLFVTMTKHVRQAWSS
jgi:hypothetical protein